MAPVRRAVRIPRPAPPLSAAEAEELSKRFDQGLDLAAACGLLSSSEIDALTDSIAASTRTEREALAHLEKIIQSRAPDGFLSKALTPVAARAKLLRDEHMTPHQLVEALDLLSDDGSFATRNRDASFIQQLLARVISLDSVQLGVFVRISGVHACFSALAANMDALDMGVGPFDDDDDGKLGLATQAAGLKLIANFAERVAAQGATANELLRSLRDLDVWDMTLNMLRVAVDSGAAGMDARICAMMASRADLESVQVPDIVCVGLESVRRLAHICPPPMWTITTVLDAMEAADECDHPHQLAGVRAVEALLKHAEQEFSPKQTARTILMLRRACDARPTWDVIRDPECKSTAHDELHAIAEALLPMLSITTTSPQTAVLCRQRRAILSSGGCASTSGGALGEDGSGSGSGAPELRTCSDCQRRLTRANYSNNQWSGKAFKATGTSRCMQCIDRANGTPRGYSPVGMTPRREATRAGPPRYSTFGPTGVDYSSLRKKRCMWCATPGCVECALGHGADPFTVESYDECVYGYDRYGYDGYCSGDSF